jgi:hypothetical protein
VLLLPTPGKAWEALNLCVDSSRPNEMEDDLKKIKNGKQPQKIKNGRRPQIKNGRGPQKKWKTTFKSKGNHQKLPKNAGENLSLGWLSSLRFSEQFLFWDVLVVTKGV